MSTQKKYINPKQPFVLILNGTSSAGKTTIAKVLAEQIHPDKGIVVLSVDSFVDMLPNQLVGDYETAAIGFRFVKESNCLNVEIGPLGMVLIEQMYTVAKNIYKKGYSVIIDDVLIKREMPEIISCDDEINLIKVLVTCDLSELKRRESHRNDRKLGLAEGLLYVNQNPEEFDLVIDTTTDSAISLLSASLYGKKRMTSISSSVEDVTSKAIGASFTA